MQDIGAFQTMEITTAHGYMLIEHRGRYFLFWQPKGAHSANFARFGIEYDRYETYSHWHKCQKGKAHDLERIAPKNVQGMERKPINTGRKDGDQRFHVGKDSAWCTRFLNPNSIFLFI
jgi:hypothetical protein